VLLYIDRYLCVGNHERRNNNINNKYLNTDNFYYSSSTRGYKNDKQYCKFKLNVYEFRICLERKTNNR